MLLSSFGDELFWHLHLFSLLKKISQSTPMNMRLQGGKNLHSLLGQSCELQWCGRYLSKLWAATVHFSLTAHHFTSAVSWQPLPCLSLLPNNCILTWRGALLHSPGYMSPEVPEPWLRLKACYSIGLLFVFLKYSNCCKKRSNFSDVAIGALNFPSWLLFSMYFQGPCFPLSQDKICHWSMYCSFAINK